MIRKSEELLKCWKTPGSASTDSVVFCCGKTAAAAPFQGLLQFFYCDCLRGSSPGSADCPDGHSPQPTEYCLSMRWQTENQSTRVDTGRFCHRFCVKSRRNTLCIPRLLYAEAGAKDPVNTADDCSQFASGDPVRNRNNRPLLCLAQAISQKACRVDWVYHALTGECSLIYPYLRINGLHFFYWHRRKTT